MNLTDLIYRQPAAEPWAEGEKIPWNDPDFSRRMLQEHLSQEHDHASRRHPHIDRHVTWLHHHVLGGGSTRILDLGCGPGLYALRLARLGHEVTGIDFSPASIDYGRQQARQEGLLCRFIEGDIRTTTYGSGYGLAMLIFGEFNVFHPEDARTLLRKIHDALNDDGILVLEPHTFEAVQRMGQTPPTWYTSTGGLFSAQPHLVLMESFWQAEQQVASERYFIVDAHGEITRHAASTQAYSEEAYRALLAACGFADIQIYPSLHGEIDAAQVDFCALVARKK